MPAATDERRIWSYRSAAAVMPWLLSTTVHLVLIVVFAVTLFRFEGGLGDRMTEPIALVVSLGDSAELDSVDPAQEPGEASAEAAEATDAAAEFVPIEIAAPAETPIEPPAPIELPLPPNKTVGPLVAGDLDAQARRLAAALRGNGRGDAPKGDGRRSGGRGDYGGKARTEVFGLAGEGYSFAYVFDRSGSMDGYRGAPLAAAKAQLLGSLADLGPSHQFQIIFYNEEPRLFNPTGTPGRLAFANDANKAAAARFVRGIVADGATRHEEALMAGLRMGPDVLFFLTDADEPGMSAGQLARVARANKGTIIHAIEFGYGVQVASRNFLVRLAESSGGSHAYVDVADLPAQ